LENWFQNDKKKIVSIEEKNKLARSLNLTTKQVSFWIHYRSKKEKQNKMGITETKKRRRINKECKKLLLNYFTNTSYSPSSVEIKILAYHIESIALILYAFFILSYFCTIV